MGPNKVTVSIDQLVVGVTCSQPILGEAGVLLLGANTRITQQVITGLRERDIRSIEVDPCDLALLSGVERKRIAPKREFIREAGWAPSKPVKEILVDRHGEDLDVERANHISGRMTAAKRQFDELRSKLLSERIRSVSDFVEISDGFAYAMVDDHDLTVGSMAGNFPAEATAERSVRMSVLGMSVAIEMGLDGQRTIEVGIAGLLHDVGLYAMDPELLKPVELMSDAQRWEYQKHPLIAAKCVADVMEVPHNIHMAIEQVHEQFDGSGFPRGVKSHRIHLYARILNVVDAYLQLTMPNSQRNPVIAHDALGLLLHQAARGMFDPTVIRAFLNVESLFPLGSHVELSSGEIAKVIRRPLTGFSTPVVWTAEGKRIDLDDSDIKIIRPAGEPNDGKQIRLTQTMMQSCEWNPACSSLLV